jgi:hypothetical protein
MDVTRFLMAKQGQLAAGAAGINLANSTVQAAATGSFPLQGKPLLPDQQAESNPDASSSDLLKGTAQVPDPSAFCRMCLHAKYLPSSMMIPAAQCAFPKRPFTAEEKCRTLMSLYQYTHFCRGSPAACCTALPATVRQPGASKYSCKS